MDKKPDTGKYLPVRITGDFERHVTEIARKYAMSKAGAVRYCVKRVYEAEFPDASSPPARP